MPEARVPLIYVLAGTNGAGKSSLLGAMFEASGSEFFNPDQAARQILEKNPTLAQTDANSVAWQEGKRLLEKAIREKLDYAFETTLGGKTITSLLAQALSERIEVHIWYVGLEGEELHIRRVESRIAAGGHAIPEEKICERYVKSRLHLIELLPHLTELFVYDNSQEADPKLGIAPEPQRILHVASGKILECCPLDQVPDWAKPIVAAAMKLGAKNS